MVFLIFASTNNRGNCYSFFLQGFISMVFIINAKRACTLLRCLFVSLFLLLQTTKVTANDGVRLNNDYVLIVNSHTESTAWSNNIISPVMDHVSASGLDVFTEHMNMMVLNEAELLVDFQNYLFKKYQARPPRLLILLDTSTVLLKDGIRKFWGDIPTILCAEQDYIGPSTSYFSKEVLAVEDRIPLSKFLESCNLTFLHSPVYIKENVELMRYVIPNMNRLIFVADGRYINQQLSSDLSRLLKKEYGQISYQFLSAENLTTDQLMEELSCIDNFTTGVLFSSWLQTTNIAGNTLLMANSHKVFAANSIAPLFSLRYTNIKNDGMIGGYIFDNEAYISKLLATITDVLNGIEPRNIPHYCPDGGIPTFNYAALLQKGLSPDVCPVKSSFIAMPPTFLQKNKYLLFTCFFMLVAFVYFLIQQNRIRSLRRVKDAQQKLKDTNDKLAMVLGVANILSWKWDLKTKTIHYDLNRGLGEEASDDKEESFQLTEEQYFDQIVDEDRELIWQAYESVKNGTVRKINIQYRVHRFNGEFNGEYWVEAHAAVASRDKQGNPFTIIGSLLNITERKKMEEALVLEKERAEESSRLKSAFLANISHEIRTPLNAIVGFSTILLSEENEEDKQEYMELIEKNNELLLQLISDIIDLSKIEAGSLDFTYSNIEVNELMMELERAVLPKINENKVSLIFEAEMPLCHLHTDKSRLAQLLLNMLVNAAKFTAEGCIRFGYRKLGDNKIYFYVADTGCGIPKEEQEAIFKRFVKLDDFSQGTGLGLSICQVIAQQMGGEIGVESEEGKGSTFWFTLPYRKPTK